jgi:hypothetical protein
MYQSAGPKHPGCSGRPFSLLSLLYAVEAACGDLASLALFLHPCFHRVVEQEQYQTLRRTVSAVTDSVILIPGC